MDAALCCARHVQPSTVTRAGTGRRPRAARRIRGPRRILHAGGHASRGVRRSRHHEPARSGSAHERAPCVSAAVVRAVGASDSPRHPHQPVSRITHPVGGPPGPVRGSPEGHRDTGSRAARRPDRRGARHWVRRGRQGVGLGVCVGAGREQPRLRCPAGRPAVPRHRRRAAGADGIHGHPAGTDAAVARDSHGPVYRRVRDRGNRRRGLRLCRRADRLLAARLRHELRDRNRLGTASPGLHPLPDLGVLLLRHPGEGLPAG